MSKLNSNLMEEKKRGFFLVIEGISKSGKQSQADLLEKFLINSKQKVKVIRKKSKFPIAAENINVTEKIENLKEMKYRARHMLYVYNLWQMREDILRDLAEGITVIFINYCYCNVAAGLQKQLTWEFLTLPCQGLVRPDLVFFLDVNKEDILKRLPSFQEESEEEQENYFDQYENFMKMRYWKVVDAKKNKQDVHGQIISELTQLENEYKRQEMEDFKKNFYPKTIGEDVFLYPEV